MVDRKWIGTKSEVRYADVEAGQLRLFALATGSANPIYTDEDAAKAAGFSAIPAPPTFTFSLSQFAPAKLGGIRDMGVNIGNVLHGEQQFDYHRPIVAGDRISLETTTTDIYEKKGGALEFIVQETTYTNQAGELCVTARTVIVVRN